MHKIIKIGAVVIALSLSLVGCDSNAGNQEDVEKLREEQIEKWGGAGVPKPKEVAKMATSFLNKPLSEQSISKLKKVAKESNVAANYVGFILDEYSEYHRDNYQYEFVQEKVAPFHDKFVSLSNKLKNHRNQAFFNIGKKLVASGDDIKAFFYFRDAYRLSTFDKGGSKGMRYQAEQEMKALLGISDYESFISWQ